MSKKSKKEELVDEQDIAQATKDVQEEVEEKLKEEQLKEELCKEKDKFLRLFA